MAKSPRERFIRERERISGVENDEVRHALEGFADALDPEVAHETLPIVERGNIQGRESRTNGGAKSYLSIARSAFGRGLPILTADAETVNRFMQDLVTEPARRRYDLVDYDGSLKRTTAKNWQGALRTFYRWATDPGASGPRPDVEIEWPADEIHMFRTESDPKHDADDLPDSQDLDALRAACKSSMNTARDRAFLELAAGTGQRVYALVTLRVGDVRLDENPPLILLNDEIRNDGDKGAIDAAGRWRPMVSDPSPVREWLQFHPLREKESRKEAGAPSDFGDCYLFVGDPAYSNTDLTSHWDINAARQMLGRRAEFTRQSNNLHSVTVPVNPHNWRHYAYTRSQDIPDLDEPTRRKVFGWQPGSNTGEALYGHETGRKAGERFAKLWDSHYGSEDENVESEPVIAEGDIADLSAEEKRMLVAELLKDQEASELLASEVTIVPEKLEAEQ